MELTANDKVCATGKGLFVAVKKGILLIIGGIEVRSCETIQSASENLDDIEG